MIVAHNLACILLFNYLLKKSFHLIVQDIIINLMVNLTVHHCQMCYMGVWYSIQNVECYISDMFFDSSASLNHGAFR